MKRLTFVTTLVAVCGALPASASAQWGGVWATWRWKPPEWVQAWIDNVHAGAAEARKLSNGDCASVLMTAAGWLEKARSDRGIWYGAFANGDWGTTWFFAGSVQLVISEQESHPLGQHTTTVVHEGLHASKKWPYYHRDQFEDQSIYNQVENATEKAAMACGSLVQHPGPPPSGR